MHVRSVAAAALVLAVAVVAVPARARAQATDPLADGLTPGDYMRISGSSISPISPSGSLKDWSRGVGLGFVWENWDVGRNGVGRIGYGLGLDYSLLPFNEQQFLSEFISPVGTATSATAKRAGVFQAGVNIRVRIPSPFIMPSITVGFGFVDWAPGQITYKTATTTATAKQQHRSGGSLSIAGGLDKHIYDRFAIFGEAVYTYGYTSFGQGLAGSGSTCLTSSCDLLKNTPFGVVRGGLRVHVGQ